MTNLLQATDAITYAQRWAAGALGVAETRPSVVCVKQGWGALRFGRSVMNLPLCLQGRNYVYGLGTHADSEVCVSSAQPLRRFRAVVGIDENWMTRMNVVAPVTFAVLVGEEERWRSPALTTGDAPVTVELSLPDVTALRLTATAAGSSELTHVDWAEATVWTADGTEYRFGEGRFDDFAVPAAPPMAFNYGGRPSGALLPGWEISRQAPVQTEAGPTEYTVSWRDPESGLRCTLELRTFRDFPAVEWLLRLHNTGSAETPILEDIQALDTTWGTASTPENSSVLYRSSGSQCAIDDFLYRQDPVRAPSSHRMAAGGARSSSHWLPFFNLQTGEVGVIAGIGWTGQWSAEVSREEGQAIRLRAGQERTHLSLHPGESIRTPRMLLLFWGGEPLNGHNLLRQFMLRYHTPTPDGRPLLPPICSPSWGGMRTDEHLAHIAEYQRQGCRYDYYWVDAGWFGTQDKYLPLESGSDWWRQVGNWYAGTLAHPHGLRPISDAAHAAGMKFLLWVEPERAMSGTSLPTEHPEWYLGEVKEGASLLFNLGIPEAREYLTELVSGLISDFGIDGYRQDFNLFEPLPYLRAADAPERVGMAEIRYIEGLYLFLDELLRRHPELFIDNCSSGGRRLDFEMMGRSIPLWRSDWQCDPQHDPTGTQTHGAGLNYWFPLHGTSGGYRPGDTYSFRSALSAAIAFSGLLAPEGVPADAAPYPWDWHRRMMAEHRRARPYYFGDYYPLTACSAASDVWCAYQLHRPDLEEGLLLAFRRDKSPFLRADFPLRGLTAGATYRLEDADSGECWKVDSATLQSTGVRIEMPTPRESRLVFYRKI